MGLFNFKKKKKKEFPQTKFTNEGAENYQLSYDINEIPKEALNIIYKEKMDEYEKLNGKGDPQLLKEISIIWKVLREGANSQYYDYFEAKGIPREIIKQTSIEELEKFKKVIDQADKALEELSKPNEVEIEAEKLVKEKIKNDRLKIQKQNAAIQQSEFAKKMKSIMTHKKEKIHLPKELQPEKEEERVLLNDVEVDQESLKRLEKEKLLHEKEELLKKDITKLEEEISELKKKPKQKGGFFKKKVKKHKDGVPDKPIKKQMFTSLKKKKEGYNISSEENDLVCTECSHFLKNHHKNGISQGCIKCACMMTIEQIAEIHGVILKKYQEDGLDEKPKQIVQEPTIEVPKEIDDDIIVKQAKQIKSMIPKNPTSTTKPLKAILKNEDEPDENQFIEDKEQCICGHLRTKHYEGRFCFSCDCSQFVEYKEDSEYEKKD